jgi:hypothetical protein
MLPSFHSNLTEGAVEQLTVAEGSYPCHTGTPITPTTQGVSAPHQEELTLDTTFFT